ncbi:unnamed protein product [Durusdinium trenchii]
MVLTPGFFPRRKKVLGTATSRDGQHFTLDPSEPSGNSSVQGQTPDFSPGQGSGRQPMRYMVRPPSSDRPPGFRPTAAGDRPRDHWRLERVEQKVLESGLLALQAQLATSPKRATAVARQGSAVLRASFFERLLEGHVELKACPANDVAAAQGDLKKLSLSQLLALRILTKDFPTTSVGSLKVHGHFLAALSSELFQQLGARALGDEIATRRRLEQIGQRLVLCLGAAELLSSVAGPTLPQRWLSSIEEEDGSGSGLVLVDVCEHTAEVLEGTAGDFDPHRGVSIAVVIDLGSGSTSSVNWEVVTMDAAKDDIPAAMAALRARKRRSTFRGRKSTSALEETPEDSARHFPVLPFATEELFDGQEGSSGTRRSTPSKQVDWPSPTPQHRTPRGLRPKDSRFNE